MRKFLKICRKCHDVLESIILAWENAIQRLYRYREFYEWIADAFLRTDDVSALKPVVISEPIRYRQLPWAGYIATEAAF